MVGIMPEITGRSECNVAFVKCAARDEAGARDKDAEGLPSLGGTSAALGSAARPMKDVHARPTPFLNKSFSLIRLGDHLAWDPIGARFDALPLDRYVEQGFRRKSLARVRVRDHALSESDHAPLFQPKAYNPVHGGLVREYSQMEAELLSLLAPAVRIFAACAHAGPQHEILVQAQRVTASGGQDGSTGFPAVEGWHQDNTTVLGLLLVARSNIEGGISMLSFDAGGTDIGFAQRLERGDLLLVDDTKLWHYTTPIVSTGNAPAYRDVVILTWPSCRETRAATRRPSSSFPAATQA
jgi:hypothetical protein